RVVGLRPRRVPGQRVALRNVERQLPRSVVVLGNDLLDLVDPRTWRGVGSIEEPAQKREPFDSKRELGERDAPALVRHYVPSCQLSRYDFCSGVSVSIWTPIVLSLRLAMSLSSSCGTLCTAGSRRLPALCC